ncbi:putative flavin-containing monoamine oxidase AofH isoform X1 [Drosophila subobscura]|uniref:putative flavin-containing monoamine oxidase AofH isoform X1 n=2 Tax=Drosophila subobscura TaxID=7241 RepID=UPI00155AC529|nr:putative flavin-containing monoamine oxidase AofH isoform X1 [Drosophila subobscura]
MDQHLPFGTEQPELDVVIVGAGLSGLTSAVKLLAKETTLNIRILDENSHPGGQLGQTGSGFRYVDEEQHDMLAFMNDMQVLPRNRRCANAELQRCWSLDRGPTAQPAKFELCRYIQMLNLRMGRFRSKKFILRERVPSMERHITSNLFFSKSRSFMRNFVELVCGVHARAVDYDTFMSVCSSCGGLAVLLDFYFNFPNTFLELSTQKLIESILEKIQYITITQNVRVVRVQHFKDYVELTDALGEKYTAQALILAIPWNKVERIQFEPPIPKDFCPPPKAKLKPGRLITQFSLSYSKCHWAEAGYSGNFLSSKPLVCGHECRQATYCGYMVHSAQESDSVRQTVLDLLASHYGDEMREPLKYQQSTTELSMARHKPQVTPWHRVIWSSSSAVATNYRSLMGGAVQSGVRAAVSALFVVRPQLVSWVDMLEVRETNPYERCRPPDRLSSLLSRLNLYNVTFYSFFILGLLWLLKIGYCHAIRTHSSS